MEKRLDMRVPAAWIKAVDSWRAKQSPIPSRSGAIRELTTAAIIAARRARIKPQKGTINVD